MSQGNGKTETTVEMQFSQCCRRRGARSTSRQNSTMDAWADNIEFIDRPTRGSIPCSGPRPARGSIPCQAHDDDEMIKPTRGIIPCSAYTLRDFGKSQQEVLPCSAYTLLNETTNKRFLPCSVQTLMMRNPPMDDA